METNLDILYTIFALHGETAIILEFCNSNNFRTQKTCISCCSMNVLLQELCFAPH